MEQPNSTTATRTNVEDVVRVVRQIIAQRELKIGRAGGIVVSDGRLERNLNTVESLTQIAKRQGWTLQSIVLSAVVAPASASDMRLLRLPADRLTVYAVTRLRMLGDAPLSVETNHLPAYLFPGFLNRDLSMSFYGLHRHCGSTEWPMTSRAGRASARPTYTMPPASGSRCIIRGLCGCPHHSGEPHKPRMVVYGLGCAGQSVIASRTRVAASSTCPGMSCT